MKTLPIETGYVTEMATLFENEMPVAVMVKVQNKTMTFLFQDKIDTDFTPGCSVFVQWGLSVGQPMRGVEGVEHSHKPPQPEDNPDLKDDYPFGMAAPMPMPKPIPKA